jgi:hypothetical protein
MTRNIWIGCGKTMEKKHARKGPRKKWGKKWLPFKERKWGKKPPRRPKQHKARRQNKKKETASERTSKAENTQRRKLKGRKREREKKKEPSTPRNEVASHKRQPLQPKLF